VKFADFSAVRGNVPVATLAVCPHLNRLTGLTVSGKSVTGRMFDELLDGGGLRGLKKLSFDETNIDPSMYRQILSNSRLPGLEELSFMQFELTDASWFLGLAEANVLRQVRAISLRISRTFTERLNEFVMNPALANLRRLEVSSHLMFDHVQDTNPVLRTIGESSHLTNLTELELTTCMVSDGDLAAFTANPRFNQLRRLGLSMNRITGVGVQAILNAEHLRGLYYLNLDANHITGKSRWKELLRKWCPEAIVRVN
jgi:hypothetical protein